MATRNLTSLFRQRRNGHRNSSPTSNDFNATSSFESKKTLLNNDSLFNGDGVDASVRVAVSDPQQPLWVDIRDSIEADFRQLAGQLQKLQDAQDGRLRDAMGNRSASYNRAIDDLSEKIPAKIREVTKKIRRVGQIDGVSPEDAKVRKAISMELSQRAQQRLKDFRTHRNGFLEKLKMIRHGAGDLLPRNIELAGLSFDDSPDHDAFGDHGGMMMQQQMEDGVHDEAMLALRDRDINKIATSIEELSEMFQEISVLIIEQGSILDRIDYNMECVVERTQAGVKELEKAEELQKGNRALHCIAILVCLITVLTCLYIVKKAG